MTEQVLNISGRNCHIISVGDNPSAVIVKPLGEFEWRLLKEECCLIAERTTLPFTMVAFEVNEDDLRPQGAENTFNYLKDCLIPYILQSIPHEYVVIGGYSLGGLFALWSATKLDGIDAVFAGSPSLWMDGWHEYAAKHPVKAKFVYMSLGNKEECTKKQPFCKVGDRVRQQHQLHLSQLGEHNCILEWNEGGHFADIEQRKARGFAWCLERVNNMTNGQLTV